MLLYGRQVCRIWECMEANKGAHRCIKANKEGVCRDMGCIKVYVISSQVGRGAYEGVGIVLTSSFVLCGDKKSMQFTFDFRVKYSVAILVRVKNAVVVQGFH